MKKKVFAIAAAIICVTVIFTLTACSANGFLSNLQTNNLYKTYGRPEAEMTLNYKVGNDNFEVKIVYSLLTDKTPVTVVNFINLVNKGFYDNTVIDTNRISNRYALFGGIKHVDEKFYKNNSEIKMVGEFESNNFPQPKDGYSEFSVFSLAMYHDSAVKNFDHADGVIILATDIPNLNSKNYAVFAEVKSVSVKTNDGDFKTYTGSFPSNISEHFNGFSGTTERNVNDSATSETTSKITMVSTIVTVTSIKMITEADWSKLPSVN